MKPTVTLIKELRRMGDKSDRNNYDIGDYWNAVDEASDELEHVLTERDEAIREVERLKGEAIPHPDHAVCLQVYARQSSALAEEKRRTAAFREVAIGWAKTLDPILLGGSHEKSVDAEAQKLLADSGGEKVS